MERSLWAEVGLQDPLRLLADVKKQTGAFQRNLALLAELQKVQGSVKTAALRDHTRSKRFGRAASGQTFRALRTVTPWKVSPGEWGDGVPL